MIWIHHISWVGMALVAFMLVPIIKAESEVMENIAMGKIYFGMSMQELGDKDI